MPTTNAERKKKYIEKLKANGTYDIYKENKNQKEREKRKRLKEGLANISKASREKLLKIKREKCRERVKRFRQRKKNENNSHGQSLSSDVTAKSGYKTVSALNKAAAKTNKTLPSSPSKGAQVVAKLLHSFEDNEKQKIINNDFYQRKKVSRGVAPLLITEIQQFYARDDISRISPNIKDTRYYIDPVTGKRELKPMRHLMHKLSKAYNLFVTDYASKYGDFSEQSKPPVKLAKFCALRPTHIKLVGSMPHNQCLCLYHSNFIECCSAIHKQLPEFPNYGKDLEHLLMCENPTKNCWLRKCTLCSVEKLKKALEDILQRSNGEKSLVKWIQWNKDAKTKRFTKGEMNGTMNSLVDYFVGIHQRFLEHSNIKRLQENSYQDDTERIQRTGNVEALLHIDFAESFPCEAQDEIQVAHWNQRNISLFTAALKHSQQMHSHVIVSDNTDHSKDTIVAYLYKMFLELPKTIKRLKIWSDGPTPQFKNKYIAATIRLLEKEFGIKIVWNYFSTSHGKGCVDGLGAVAKTKVKGLVLERKEIVKIEQLIL